MAPLLDAAARHAQFLGLVRIVAASLIVAAIVIAASVAFGWTLPAAPAFELTPDPAGNLPF